MRGRASLLGALALCVSSSAACGVPDLPDGAIDAGPDAVATDAPTADAPATDMPATDAPLDGGTDALADMDLDAGHVCTTCGDACVETWRDPLNCNGCGTPCPFITNGEATCTEFVCGGRCGVGYTLVTTNCVRDTNVRLVAPLSTAWVTSLRPTFRVDLPSGATGAHVQICADRGCSAEEQAFDTTGAVGTPASDLGEGVHYWRAFAITGGVTGTAPSAVWELFARDASRGTGGRSSLADVNGDGLVDLLVSGRHDAPDYAGALYQYRAAGPSAFEPTPSATIVGVPMDGLGDIGTVAAADFDGDGYADVAIGAYTRDPYEHFDELSGGPGGLDATRLVRHDRPAEVDPGYGFGGALGAVGDVDRDGYADLAVGTFYGGVHLCLYRGGPVGLGSYTCWGSGTGGRGPLALGDVDGDGFDDFAVASQNDGAVSVFAGSGSGISTTSSWTFIDPAAVDGLARQHLAAGDFDGDGHLELVVGVPYLADPPPVAAHVYVFAGGGTGFFAATPTTTIDDPRAPLRGGSGFGDALTVVDVDGDGYDDLAVGSAPTFGDPGIVRIYRGSAGGLVTSSPLVLSMPTENGFGSPLAPAGDVNGDGLEELFVADPRASTDTGRVYLVLGAASLGSPVLSWTGSTSGEVFGLALANGS